MHDGNTTYAPIALFWMRDTDETTRRAGQLGAVAVAVASPTRRLLVKSAPFSASASRACCALGRLSIAPRRDFS
eukprot:5688272-Pleurochrysis_carterae.AAC.2